MHELIERFDGHLKAEQYYSVVANMRGNSAEEVATLLLTAPGLQGLQVRLGLACHVLVLWMSTLKPLSNFESKFVSGCPCP